MSPAGRPPLDEEDRRDGQIRVRVTAAEKEILDSAADASGKPTTTWLRDLGLAAAAEIAAAAPKKKAAKK